jgi:hypothetical protein
MKRLLAVALFVSVPAMAEGGPGSGLQLELNVLGANSFTQIDEFAGAGPAAGLIALTVTPTASVGYQVNQNAFLLGIGLAAVSGPTIGFGFSPTYRRYLQPLNTMTVIPFAQGTIGFALVAPNGGPSDFTIGIGGGGGAEWLFTDHIGLVADAELVYAHLNANNTNIDSIGIEGQIGLTIHF